MWDKRFGTPDEAIKDIPDGALILCGGFGGAGYPTALIRALARRRVQELTIVSNNAGHGPLFEYGGVRKVVCSYPMGPSSRPFFDRLKEGLVELELEPQGTLVERLRAGGAGIAGVLTTAGLDTELTKGKAVVTVDGRRMAVLPPLRGDFALVRAWRADPLGNLVFRHAGRNFNPLMARAADTVIAEVEEIVGAGELDPNCVHTPAAFVDRVVAVGRPEN